MSGVGMKLALPNLPQALRDAGLTQRELAKRLGIHDANISRLIQGKAKMLTRERIQQIETITGRSFEYLADLKGAALRQDETDDLRALRNAPPEVQEFIRRALDPYRTN